MYLGRNEVIDNPEEDVFSYTPFKTFNRRRNYLVWLFNDKFDYLFTEEEKMRRNQAEDFVFKSSVSMKLLSLAFFLNIRLYKRPQGRSYAFDLLQIYLGTYCFLGSNIPGVHSTWHMYSDLA